MAYGTIQAINSATRFKILEEGSTVVHPGHVDQLEGIDKLPDDEEGRNELIGRRVSFNPRTPSTHVKSVAYILWI